MLNGVFYMITIALELESIKTYENHSGQQDTEDMSTFQLKQYWIYSFETNHSNIILNLSSGWYLFGLIKKNDHSGTLTQYSKIHDLWIFSEISWRAQSLCVRAPYLKQEATSMLVTDVGNGLFWWRWDVTDRFSKLKKSPT